MISMAVWFRAHKAGREVRVRREARKKYKKGKKSPYYDVV